MIKCILHDGEKSEILKNEKKKMRDYLHSNVTLLLVGHSWKLRVLQVLCPLHAAEVFSIYMSPGSVYLVTCSESIQNHSSDIKKCRFVFMSGTQGKNNNIFLFLFFLFVKCY